MLEAMACGVPVITSNTSSMPEVAGDAAILINPFDHNEITAAMVNLYNNKALREELIQRGFLQSAKFSWKAMAENILKIYKDTTREHLKVIKQ
jgi:glycosyltransferase involved in cell wall biosynthesis